MRREKYPLISVIMLNYNGLKYLKRTIPPILKLDYPNYEFIIVDNGSTDGSIKFIKKNKNIRLIENGENLGYSKGKNIGVKKAKGKYILLLDNDILIKDKKLLNKLIYLKEKNNSIIQPTLVDINRNETSHYGIFYSYYGTNLHKPCLPLNLFKKSKTLLEIGAATGGIMFFKKTIFANIGYFDESQKFNLDDFEIGMRAWIFGYKELLYTKTRVIHLGITHSQNPDDYARRFKMMFSGKARAILKNYTMINIFLRFPIMFFFQLVKSLRYSFKKRSIKVFFAFLWSIGFFLKNLPDALKERKKIQSKRIIKEDIFLKIKPPKFN